MECNLSSSPPCIPFYSYTMFQYPMPKPSCQKSRYTIMAWKVLVTLSSNIVHCRSAYPKTNAHRFWSLLKHCFPDQIDGFFFIFLKGRVQQFQAKISHFVDFDWEKCIKMAWVVTYLRFEACCQIHCALVSSLYNKWFTDKSQFQAKISHFVDFDWEKCIEMAWVVHI